ncbi:pyroglutamyl-peptidase 1 isoform 2-T2 [Molossus nigricans]
MEQPRKAVVVTGFGPFGEHTVNASWIAVQELEKLGLGDSVDLHVYEIPLVVHVGVSGMATTVTLEKCGHNKGYKGLDNCRFCPGSQCCVEDGPESIDSIIDMDAVCKRVTTLGLDVSVTISQDAGRVLGSSRSRCWRGCVLMKALLQMAGFLLYSHMVPLRLHLLHLSVPESWPLSLCPCASTGQAIQRRPAGQGSAGHHRGDAGCPGAVRRQNPLSPQTLRAMQASQDQGPREGTNLSAGDLIWIKYFYLHTPLPFSPQMR